MISSSVSGYPLSFWQRGLLAAWSLFLLAGFVFARQLEPSPLGYGTHQQLGFNPCSFRELLGVPCPSCGGTTCFAHFVRGEFQAAANANPGAFLLALFCLTMIPWSWGSIWLGRLWGVDNPTLTLLAILIVLCAVALLHWMWRLANG